ncbi:hypothetical protein WDU99_07845 [Microbacterium sp. Mu-80]|uniref:Uncharacterized protein n=1 Tax=Microbacterium bandirmense TaxID=3122050 RepID=A0ABU8LA88_9MICO
MTEPSAEDAPRVREIRSPGLQIVTALTNVLIGLTLGSVVTFLGVVVLAIVVEETGVLGLLGVGLDFDALFRASMGPVLISWGVMLIAWPTLTVARAFVTLAAVEALIDEHPESVPPRAVRESLKTSPAKTCRDAGTVICWITGIVLALCVLLSIYMAGEDFDSLVISLIITAVVLGLFLVGYAMTAYGRRSAPAQEELIAGLQSAWGWQVPRADAAERALRKTLPVAELPRMLRTGRRGGAWTTVLGWMLGLGTLIFLFGVLLRQPCRNCEQRTFGPTGESLIDSATSLGGGMLTVAGVICAVLWLVVAARRIVIEEVLRRWLVAGGARRVDDERRVAELLNGESAVSLATMTLAGFGTAVLIIAGGIAMVDWEGVDASIALAVGQGMLFASALLGIFAYHREVGLRVLVRERLLPGNAPNAADLTKRRSKR